MMIAKMEVEFVLDGGEIRAVMGGQACRGKSVMGPYVLELNVPAEVLNAQRAVKRGLIRERALDSR